MSLRATLRCWWRAIAQRGRVAAEAEDELRFHVEAYATELVRRGVAPEEATRRARLEMGEPETHGERYRSAVGLRPFDELGGDVRFGLRSLVRNPGYAAVGVLSLALGIGATTAMFSLMYAVLLQPFPYLGADRIMNPAIINEEEPSKRSRRNCDGLLYGSRNLRSSQRRNASKASWGSVTRARC